MLDKTNTAYTRHTYGYIVQSKTHDIPTRNLAVHAQPDIRPWWPRKEEKKNRREKMNKNYSVLSTYWDLLTDTKNLEIATK